MFSRVLLSKKKRILLASHLCRVALCRLCYTRVVRVTLVSLVSGTRVVKQTRLLDFTVE